MAVQTFAAENSRELRRCDCEIRATIQSGAERINIEIDASSQLLTYDRGVDALAGDCNTPLVRFRKFELCGAVDLAVECMQRHGIEADRLGGEYAVSTHVSAHVVCRLDVGVDADIERQRAREGKLSARADKKVGAQRPPEILPLRGGGDEWTAGTQVNSRG